MNRLVAEGLWREASRGRDVLVLSDTHNAAYGAFADFEALTRARVVEDAAFRRSVGSTRVTLPNGATIRFCSIRANLEGMRPGLIYVEPLVDRRLFYDAYERHIAVLAARGAEVMEA